MPPPPVPKRKRDSDSPAPESSASPSSPESEYDPRGVGVSKGGSKQKRVASKPATASKVGPNGRPLSREQLRKANHSLIERRRREKINTALSELRAMVPGLGEENGGKGGEFKLEVLERTVVHMRLLKDQVAELEAELRGRKRHCSTESGESMQIDQKPQHIARELPKHSSTPPSPSMTPPSRHEDPNETEDEANLPPPHAIASRPHSDHSSGHTASPHPPSISSLLTHSHSHTSSAPRTIPQRPAASPNIYLPFPTPSPTSPFLTYHPSSASTASSATGPPEPSPFLAPLQNISLFGGALDLQGKQPSPPEGTRSLRDMGAEEAASVLLAISSPDTMRPTPGSTPLMAARGRPLDEDFTLDGGVATVPVRVEKKFRTQQGKTARDILRM